MSFYADEFDLTLTGDTFNALKSDFNQVLRKTLTNMEAKGSELAELTIKLKITLKKDTAPDFSQQVECRRDIMVPKFDHKVSSVMQIKEEVTGSMGGDYELVWDEARDKYVMRKIVSNQMNIFDCPYTVVHEDGDGAEGDEQEALEGKEYAALPAPANEAPDNDEGPSDDDEPDSDNENGEDNHAREDSTNERLSGLESCRASFPDCLCCHCVKFDGVGEEDCCYQHDRDCTDKKPCSDFEGYPDKAEPTDAEKRKAAINKALGIIHNAAEGGDQDAEGDYPYEKPEDAAV